MSWVEERAAREIMRDVSFRLARVARYAEGSPHATLIASNEVQRALRDLGVAKDKLAARYDAIRETVEL